SRLGLRVRRSNCRNRRQASKGSSVVGLDAVDGVLEFQRPQLLCAEALDDGQQNLDAVLITRQSLFIEVGTELRHVARTNSEDAQRLQCADVLGALDL